MYHMYMYHIHVCAMCMHIIYMYHMYTYHVCMYVPHVYTHIHVCITESFCSTPEINTLYINHNSILKIITL